MGFPDRRVVHTRGGCTRHHRGEGERKKNKNKKAGGVGRVHAWGVCMRSVIVRVYIESDQGLISLKSDFFVGGAAANSSPPVVRGRIRERGKRYGLRMVNVTSTGSGVGRGCAVLLFWCVVTWPPPPPLGWADALVCFAHALGLSSATALGLPSMYRCWMSEGVGCRKVLGVGWRKVLDGRRCWMVEGVGWQTVLDGRRYWMADDVGWQTVFDDRRCWMADDVGCQTMLDDRRCWMADDGG